MPSRGRLIRFIREIGRSLVRVDRSALTPVAGARAAAGVALPLAVLLAVGRPVTAVVVSVGALSAGWASRQGAYRSRALAVAATALAMAVSTFAGALAGNVRPVAVVLLAAWGFGAGMLAALGPVAITVGLQAVVALLVVAQYPMNVAAAAGRAGLVVAGAAVQLVLVTLGWSLRRYPAERASLAAAYRSLAGYARRLSAERPPDPATIGEARRVLVDRQPFGRPEQLTAFEALVHEADRVRTALAGLATARGRLAADGSPYGATAIDEISAAAADLLDGVAVRLEHRAGPADLPAGAQVLTEMIDRRVTGAGLNGDALATTRRVALHVTHAVQALDGVRGDDEWPDGPESAAAEPSTRTGPQGVPLSIASATRMLRDNLTPGSAVWRHAVRLAVALAVADTLAELSGLQRGYWVPLTALVVLRPDFVSTMSRGVARIVGTLTGAALATLVISTLRPGPAALAAGVVVLAFAGYTVVRANYAVFAVVITALVVLLLSFVGLPEVTAVTDRTVDTLVGGALALGAFAVWPTWERAGVAATLADLIERQGGYGAAVVRAYADPSGRDVRRLREARSAARLARSNATASVGRLAAEPARPGPIDQERAAGLLDDVGRFALAALALHTNLAAAPPAGRPAEALADAVAEAMSGLAAAVRAGGPPPDLAPLRAARGALVAAYREQPAGRPEQDGRAAAVADVELLVAAIERLAATVARASV